MDIVILFLPPTGRDLEEYTLEFILKTSDTSAGRMGYWSPSLFCNSKNNHDEQNETFLYTMWGYLKFNRYGNGASLVYIADGKIHKLALVHTKENNTKIYLDGNIILNASLEGTLNNSNLVFGGNWYTGGAYGPGIGLGWQGTYTLYSFKLYDKALNKNELFNSTGSLINYSSYKSFIKNGSTVYLRDFSGNNKMQNY